MPFEIVGKVALISGGASGIGLQYAKELLRNGLKGVSLADINKEFGENAVHEIEAEFGPKKAIFVQTDVTNKQNFEEAFKKTVDVFKNLDIVINNAGVLNDADVDKTVDINIKGVMYGTILGLEIYIPKYKTGSEGVIINISSIAGISQLPAIPVYTASKFAVVGFSKAFGDEEHYKRSKVRVVVVCPGVTDTALIRERAGKNLGPAYENLLDSTLNDLPLQKPESVAQAIIKIIKNAKTGTVWVAEADQEPYEHKR